MLVCAVVTIVSLVLGGLTSFGQTVLPGALNGLANSSSGWTLATAAVVVVARRGTRLSALLGMLSFVALPVGYSLVSDWRGYPFDPDFWAAVGVVAGPFVGAAAANLRSRGRRLALAAGLLAGILIGEALHGFLVVIDTVGPSFALLLTALGVLLILWAGLRLRSLPAVVLLIATTAAASAGLFFGYRLLGTVLSVL